MAEPVTPAAAAAEQIRKLTGTSRALTYATTADDVMELAVRHAADLLGASRTVLMVTDADGLLRVGAAHGVDRKLVEEFREPLEETLVHRLRRLMASSEDDPFLGVPLVARGEVTGLLAAARPGGAPFREQDEWSLSALADQTAVALATMRADEEVRRVIAEHRAAGAIDSAEQDRALASLGHELRSPLHAIDSYAQVLQMGIHGPLTEQQTHAVDRIRMAGQHLNSLVDRMLDMAMLSAGVTTLEPSPVPIAQVVEEAADIARPRLREGQTLKLGPLSDLTVMADPDRLRQVLVNLLTNAIKYTQEGGRIAVGAQAAVFAGRRCCVVTVADDGPGIPREEQDRIFHPYYRLRGDHTPGAGLGLAISRELVRQLGGDITVESEPGQGSTFIVRLPLAE